MAGYSLFVVNHLSLARLARTPFVTLVSLLVLLYLKTAEADPKTASRAATVRERS
jgi:hypothetical protein